MVPMTWQNRSTNDLDLETATNDCNEIAPDSTWLVLIIRKHGVPVWPDGFLNVEGGENRSNRDEYLSHIQVNFP